MAKKISKTVRISFFFRKKREHGWIQRLVHNQMLMVASWTFQCSLAAYGVPIGLNNPNCTAEKSRSVAHRATFQIKLKDNERSAYVLNLAEHGGEDIKASESEAPREGAAGEKTCHGGGACNATEKIHSKSNHFIEWQVCSTKPYACDYFQRFWRKSVNVVEYNALCMLKCSW